jgi:hypothetical protein
MLYYAALWKHHFTTVALHTTERPKETNSNYADDFKDVSAVTGIRKIE